MTITHQKQNEKDANIEKANLNDVYYMTSPFLRRPNFAAFFEILNCVHFNCLITVDTFVCSNAAGLLHKMNLLVQVEPNQFHSFTYYQP